MTIFKEISTFYNDLYKEKKYHEETKYILSLLDNKPKDILDMGCGTGGHIKYLNKYKINCLGVDISKEMLKIAKKQNPLSQFIYSDILKFKSKKKYHCVLSLFHVASYMQNYKNLEKFFNVAFKNLHEGGNFIFDFWNYDAIKADPPLKRIKRFKFKNKNLLKVSIPEHIKDSNLVKVKFYFFYENQKKEKISQNKKIYYEEHRMLLIKPIKAIKILKKVGFKKIKSFTWLTKRDISQKAWYGCILATK